MPAPTIPKNAAELVADAMKRLIRADIRAGNLPADEVRSFSDLHDHLDANVVYLSAARRQCGMSDYNPDEIDSVDAPALDIVDRWLGSHRRHF